MTQEKYNELQLLNKQLEEMSLRHEEERRAVQKRHHDEYDPILQQSYAITDSCDHVFPTGISAIEECVDESYKECEICGEIWEIEE